MKIKSVAAAPDRLSRYRVEMEDEKVLRLYRQTVQDFGLYPGMELSEAEYAKLMAAAGEMSAKMRAVRIIATTSVSQKDLEHRLLQKGETEEHAKAAVAWMKEMSLVDDRATAQQVVSNCIRKGYGLNRAKQVLFEKRIPKEFWEEVLADYPDQTDSIVAFLKSRLDDNTDQKDVKKAIDALLRRGHSYSAIRRGLEQVLADCEEFAED